MAATSATSASDACSNPDAPLYSFTIVGGVGSTMCDNVQIRSIYIDLLSPGAHFWTKSGGNVKEWQVLLSPSGYNYAVGYLACASCGTTTTAGPTTTTTASPTTTTTTAAGPFTCNSITFNGYITGATLTAYWTDCTGVPMTQLVPANTYYGPVCAVVGSASGQAYNINGSCNATTTTTTIAG
jgi:hypothetical protein